MASTVFEIVELDDGEFVLRRPSKDEEPLVSIKFSVEAIKFLAGNSSDIAKVMIEAGLLEVEDLINEHILDDESSADAKPPVLH